MSISRKPIGFLVGAVLAFAGARDAKSQVTYTYTGNDFTSFYGGSPLTTSDFITASFTFANALPDDMIYGGPDNLLNWTITDGVDTLSQSGGNYLNGFAVETDATGDISGWDINAFTSPCSPTTVGCVHFISQGPPYPTYAYIDAVTDVIDVEGDYWQASVSGSPGTWSMTGESATPEPSTPVLASIGGAMLLYTIRRRRQHRFRNTP